MDSYSYMSPWATAPDNSQWHSQALSEELVTILLIDLQDTSAFYKIFMKTVWKHLWKKLDLADCQFRHGFKGHEVDSISQTRPVYTVDVCLTFLSSSS